MKSANLQSLNQYKMNDMDHKGPDGSTSFDRAKVCGFANPSKVAENVANGQKSISEVFHSWRTSEGN